MEDSIRSDLCFDDAEGTACLLNEAIFKGLARMGAKTTSWNEFSSTMASAIICLADNQKFNFSKRIGAGFSEVITPLFDTMIVQAAADMGDTPVKTHQIPIVYHLSTSRPQKKQKPRRKQRKEVEDKDAQSKEIAALKKKVSKLLKWRKSRSRGLRRLMKIGSGRRVKSLLENDSLVSQKDTSKHGRMIEKIDQDDEIALDADTQERKNDDEMFGIDGLSGEELVLDTTTVTTIVDKVSTAPTTDVTKDEITMAQALATLKSTKPKVVVQEQEMSTTLPAAATTVTTAVPTPRAKGIVFHEQKQSHIPTVSSSKDKGKAKMIEPEVPIKKKANISWDNTQAMMEADSLLAERLQAREREEFSEVQKVRLLVELIEKRKKHFAALRAQEKRNKPPTKVQMRSQTCTYLRNMGGYKHSYLKGRRYDEIKKLFDREIRKKEKVDENVEPVIDDTKELKKCMEIVPDDGDETYFKIIRADSNSQVYQTFEKMFKNVNREDLEVLWGIVKDRFKKEEPVDDMDNLMFRTLKTMFEHHVEDVIWIY
nr:hypothetical protein [Tanacetum cinerariifolium]